MQRDIDVEEALAFYQATDGDVIKDQFNFAIYDATSGWSGTLSYLQSGRGYMLNSAETQTFNYPDANVLLKTVVKQVASKTNTNDFAQYSSNMNIVAEVIADENFTKVLVFDGDNVLRGSADIVDLNDKKISFITAFSNTTELLKFVLANDTEQIDINKNFMFIDNLVMGDLKNPLKLTTSSLSTESLLLNDAVLYPNPFTSEITIDLSRENTRISKVEIFNTIGVSLISKTKGFNQKTTINTANLAKGIYLIRLTDTAGKSVIKKMIKE
ncbi:MAG: T9SS type A sorting domain-containing protein [Polaribacter sp.]